MIKFATSKKKVKSSIPELILDTICCWFITSAFVPLLFNQFIDFSLSTTLIASGLVLVLIAAVTRIKWVLPAVLGAGILGGTGYLLITKKMAWFFTYARGFIFWLMADMNAANKTYANDVGFAIVQVFLCIGVSLAVFIIIRAFHTVFPIILVSAGVYLYALLYGYRDFNLMSLMFLVAGVLPIVSVNFYTKRKMFRFIGKSVIKSISPNWKVQLTAIVLCSVSLLSSFFVVPADTSSLTTRDAANSVADIQSATNLFTKEQIASKYKNLGKLNLQRYSAIGGALFADDEESGEPFNDEVIAYVYGATAPATYLKSAVYEVYDGKMWRSDFSKAYRLGSPFFRDEQAQAFNSYATTSQKLISMLGGILTTRAISVELAKPASKLPVTCGLASFAEKSESKIPVLYNELSEIFSFKEQEAGFKYDLVYNEATINLVKIAEIAEVTKNIPDANLDDKEFVAKYTDLPDNFPLSVVNHAKKLTAESTSDFQSIGMLLQYLCDSKYFKYTNSSSLRAATSTELSFQLLSQKKGNSVYYATALATMARSLGIPSRLVAGYRVAPASSSTALSVSKWNDNLGAFEVSADDAFTWTECYLRGIGWVSFYPFPIASSAVSSGKENNDSLDHNGDDGPAFEEQTEPPKEDEIKEDEEKKDKFRFVFDWKYLIYALAFVAAIAVLLLIRSMFMGFASSLPSVRRRFRHKSNQAEYYYWDLCNQLKALKQPITNADTSKTILARLPDFEQINTLSEALEIIDRERFARRYTPSDAEIEVIASANRAVEIYLKSKCGKWRYFLYRRYLRGSKTTFVLSDTFYTISQGFRKIGLAIRKFFAKIKTKISKIADKFEG